MLYLLGCPRRNLLLQNPRKSVASGANYLDSKQKKPEDSSLCYLHLCPSFIALFSQASIYTSLMHVAPRIGSSVASKALSFAIIIVTVALMSLPVS